jgi:MFS family permease
MNFYAEKKETMVGYLEAMNASGMIIGPLIGSVLFTFGGFKFTFDVFGVFFICTTPFLKIIFPKEIDMSGSD